MKTINLIIIMHLDVVAGSCAVTGCCWPIWRISTWPVRSCLTTTAGSLRAPWRRQPWSRSLGGTTLSWWQTESRISMRASCWRPPAGRRSPATAAPCRLARWSWSPAWWWQPWLTRLTHTAPSSRSWVCFYFVLDWFCWVPVPSAGHSNSGRRKIKGERARRPLWSARNTALPEG